MNYGIIAAGKGERLATEGILLPKPLVAPDGEPLIDRLMRIMSLPRGAAAMTCLSIIVREQEIAGHVQTACEHTGIGQLTRVIVKATADSMLSFAEVTAGFDSDFIVTTVDTVFASDELVRLAEAFAKPSPRPPMPTAIWELPAMPTTRNHFGSAQATTG